MKMDIDQFADFASLVVRSLPRDMDLTTTQGWTLNPSDLADVLREALMLSQKQKSSNQPVISTQSSATIAAKYGFTVVKGQDVTPLNLTPEMMDNLKFKTFLKEGDGPYINGETMRQRAVEQKANLGLADGERLKDHMNKFTYKFKELRSNCIVLPGTLLHGSSGRLLVACLIWDGVQWVLDFYWIGYGWRGNDRFAHCE